MSHFINGEWITSTGFSLQSHDPGTNELVFTGTEASPDTVHAAVFAARNAFTKWSQTSLEDRIAYLLAFTDLLTQNKDDLAVAISKETGKPKWESLTEVAAMIGKAQISIDAYHDRCPSRSLTLPDASTAEQSFKPHGVLAVFGPFNFPGHVPNGHIIPALLAGNTVVFKPSEQTPAVAELTVKLWNQTHLPPGVLNLVQGARTTGEALVNHTQIDGVLFTGGYTVGTAIAQALVKEPGKILALELGGNNPLIVHETVDLTAAAYTTIQSAFLTAGQRCTCARRLILPDSLQTQPFIDRLIQLTQSITVDHYTAEPEPFMGPLVSTQAAQNVLNAQSQLESQGATILLPAKQLDTSEATISPALLDVTNIPSRSDNEIFGPILQIIHVPTFNDAINEANNSSYGLVAGLLSDSRDHYETFHQNIRSGLINWNKQTTGASSKLAFGGVGNSGNHRPTGYFAADYCSYPVSSLQSESLTLPQNTTPGITL